MTLDLVSTVLFGVTVTLQSPPLRNGHALPFLMPLATRVHFFLGELATLRTRAGSDSCFTTLSTWQSPSAWMDGASGSHSHGTLLQEGERSCGNVQDRIREIKEFHFRVFFFFLNKDLLCEVSRFVFLFVFFSPNKWNWAQFYVNVPKVEAFN